VIRACFRRDSLHTWMSKLYRGFTQSWIPTLSWTKCKQTFFQVCEVTTTSFIKLNSQLKSVQPVTSYYDLLEILHIKGPFTIQFSILAWILIPTISAVLVGKPWCDKWKNLRASALVKLGAHLEIKIFTSSTQNSQVRCGTFLFFLFAATSNRHAI